MHTTVIRFVDHGLPVPKVESPEAAGLVLTAAETIQVPAGGYATVKTGFVWDIPSGHTGLTSSVPYLAKFGVFTASMLIPAKQSLDERNELSVALQNMSNKTFSIIKGDVVGHVALLPVHGVRGVRETINPDMAPEEKPITSVQAYINAKEAAGWYEETESAESKPQKTRRRRATGTKSRAQGSKK